MLARIHSYCEQKNVQHKRCTLFSNEKNEGFFRSTRLQKQKNILLVQYVI